MMGVVTRVSKSAYAFFISDRCATIAQNLALFLAVLLVLMSLSLTVQDLAKESVPQHAPPARTVG